MLKRSTRYRFVAQVHRTGPQGQPVVDADPAVVTWQSLALSPLSAVMLADAVSATRVSDASETGFRRVSVAAFTGGVDDPATRRRASKFSRKAIRRTRSASVTSRRWR